MSFVVAMGESTSCSQRPWIAEATSKYAGDKPASHARIGSCEVSYGEDGIAGKANIGIHLHGTGGKSGTDSGGLAWPEIYDVSIRERLCFMGEVPRINKEAFNSDRERARSGSVCEDRTHFSAGLKKVSGLYDAGFCG